MSHVFALAADDQYAFAAVSDGLMRSLDGGGSWQPALSSADAEAELAVSAVVLVPPSGSDRTLFAAISGAILRSTDGGATWEAAQLPTPAPFITALAVSPAFERDHNLFAASLEDGVFRSIDGGATWSTWNFGLLDLQVLSLVISPNFERDQMLVTGTGSGLFISRNAGRAWREITLPCGHVPILSLAISAHRLLAGTESNGLYASHNQGQTWERWGEEIIETVNVLCVEGNATLALTQEALLLSQDEGLTWQPLQATRVKTPVVIIAPTSLGVGSRLIVGYEEGDLGVIQID